MANRIGVACFGLIGGKDLNVTLGFSLFQASEVCCRFFGFISPQKKKIIYISFACVVNVLKVAFGAPWHFEKKKILSTHSSNKKLLSSASDQRTNWLCGFRFASYCAHLTTSYQTHWPQWPDNSCYDHRDSFQICFFIQFRQAEEKVADRKGVTWSTGLWLWKMSKGTSPHFRGSSVKVGHLRICT